MLIHKHAKVVDRLFRLTTNDLYGIWRKSFCCLQCCTEYRRRTTGWKKLGRNQKSDYWTEDRRKKQSQLFKDLFASGKISPPKSKSIKQADKWEIRICEACGVEFERYKVSKTRYCSRKCGQGKNSGGYREGSGRAKSGYYKGIYCGSTYELAWLIYRLDHGLPVERFPNLLCCEKTGKKYIPDFIVGNTIFEIKGYEHEDSVAVKTKIAEDHGFTVNVLRKDDLKKEFEWVKEKYEVSEFNVLYDDYKPQFKYVCSFCNKEFSRDKKATSDMVFCSQRCSGKHMFNKNQDKLVEHRFK